MKQNPRVTNFLFGYLLSVGEMAALFGENNLFDKGIGFVVVCLFICGFVFIVVVFSFLFSVLHCPLQE